MFYVREQGDLVGDTAAKFLYIQAPLFKEREVKESIFGFISVMHIFIVKLCINLSHKTKINFL